MNSTIETALNAADSALLLDSATEISRARKAWKKSGVLGLDTEFVRERTYYANLGLVQVSDGHTVWLIDPLATDSLGPIKSMLEDPSITKLVHSPSEDLEVLLNTVGALPEPMIDTQTACAFLGQPLQLAYHAAAQWLLGVEVAKDQTRSNWLRRPLRPVQLRYAALDVCLLPEMWRQLEQRLVAAGRKAWLEEDCARQIERARQGTHDEDAWQRIRGVARLDGSSLAIIRKLASWREQESRRRNQPRGFIVPDPVLVRIAQMKLTRESDLLDLNDFHPRAQQRYGATVVGLVAEVLESGQTLEEIRPLTNPQRKTLDRMREQVQEQAKSLDVDPALLASRRELEALVREPPEQWADKFSGWRKEVLNGTLEQALN